MKSESCNVLLVASNWLGDAVMSLPLLGFLAGQSDVRLTVFAQGYTARVFWGLQQVDQLVVMAKDGPMRGLRKRSGILRRLGFDGAVLLPPSFSSALTAFLGGMRNRVGFQGDGRGFLLSEALPARGLREEHLSENFMRLGRALVRRLQLSSSRDNNTPVLRVIEHERETIRRLMQSHGVPAQDYAVVVPGATYGDTKCWPWEKYRRLVERLSGEMPVVLGGGRSERALCDGVAGGLKGVYNLAGLTELGEFLALLESARVLIANDSGAPHAAASLDTPVVVIFGSTSPTWTRPLGGAVYVVREPVHCAPCFRSKCPTQLECYRGILPEAVFKTTLSAIDRGAECSPTSARHT